MAIRKDSVRRRVAAGISHLAGIGVQTTDTSQERATKTALTLVALLLGTFAGAWTLVYFWYGPTFAWVTTLVYQMSLLFALVHFATTKSLAVFRRTSLSLHLVTPIIVQVALGGFHPSSGVALWSLVAPLGAVIAYGSRESVKWFAAYLTLVGVSTAAGVGEIASGAHVPAVAVAVFFVANIGGVSAVAFLLVRFFVRERERAIQILAEQHERLAEEQQRSERLLLNILPAPVAERLKQGDDVIAARLPDVSVLFADIVGFTELSERWPPEKVVVMLNGLFSAFDELADSWGLERIKTIGDAYMVAGGLRPGQADHLAAMAEMGFAMQREAHRQSASAGFALDLRIGFSVGPVVAGVIGRRKFAYDMWGDTVNTASRMESTGIAGSIQVSGAVFRRLQANFHFERRDRVAVRGKGHISTYILLGERDAAAAKEVP